MRSVEALSDVEVDDRQEKDRLRTVARRLAECSLEDKGGVAGSGDGERVRALSQQLSRCSLDSNDGEGGPGSEAATELMEVDGPLGGADESADMEGLVGLSREQPVVQEATVEEQAHKQAALARSASVVERLCWTRL